MSKLWSTFIAQLKDLPKTAQDLFESLVHIEKVEPEIIEQALDSVVSLRSDLAPEVINRYRLYAELKAKKEYPNIAELSRLVGELLKLGSNRLFRQAIAEIEQACGRDTAYSVVAAITATQ